MPQGNGRSLVPSSEYPHRRGGFVDYHLWITPQRDEERYAGGMYPLNSQADGLAVWAASNRPIEKTDIVAWYVMGFHHVVRAEDWPVMPVMWRGFQLRPFDFFDSNPALDLPK